MSATFRVTSGTARLRIGGMESEAAAPWEEHGVEYTPAVARPTGVGDIERFKAAVIAEMTTQVNAPGMGAADSIGRQVGATIQVEAVDDPVFLLIWSDRESAHPDETFAQGAEYSELLLQPGESWESVVCHQNAWTVLAVTG